MIMTAITIDDIVAQDLNWEDWSAMMETNLTEKGLWDVVMNGIPPDPTKTLKLAETLQVEELCRWRDLAIKDMQALKIMQSCLTHFLLNMTLSASSAKELWEMIEQVPEHASSATYFDGENEWMVHPSTTNHMTPHIKYFTTLDRTRRARVRFSKSTKTAQGTGDVRFLTRENKTVTIKNVLYVPGMAANVLCVDQMNRSGFSLEMGPKSCTLWDRKNGRLLGENMNKGDISYLHLRVIEGKLTS